MAEATGETLAACSTQLIQVSKSWSSRRVEALCQSLSSDGHFKGPGSGCVVAALGSESARAGPAVCKTFAVRIRKQIEKLSSGLLANHVLSACREDFQNGAT